VKGLLAKEAWVGEVRGSFFQIVSASRPKG